MRRRPLRVTLEARESSTIELTVGERVQLDRLTPSPLGTLADRHELLEAGRSTIHLERGTYFFRTLSDASLRVVAGGVNTTTRTDDKDPWPDPPQGVSPPLSSGDEPPGEPPRLTIR